MILLHIVLCASWRHHNALSLCSPANWSHMNRRDDQWNHFIFVKSPCHTYVILHRSWRRVYTSLLPLNTHPVFSLCTLYLTPTVPPGVWSAWPTFPPLCLCSPFSSAPFITTWENMWAVTWFHGCCPPPDNCFSCQFCVLCFHLLNISYFFFSSILFLISWLFHFFKDPLLSEVRGMSEFRGSSLSFCLKPVTDHFLFRPETNEWCVCTRTCVLAGGGGKIQKRENRKSRKWNRICTRYIRKQNRTKVHCSWQRNMYYIVCVLWTNLNFCVG